MVENLSSSQLSRNHYHVLHECLCNLETLMVKRDAEWERQDVEFTRLLALISKRVTTFESPPTTAASPVHDEKTDQTAVEELTAAELSTSQETMNCIGTQEKRALATGIPAAALNQGKETPSATEKQQQPLRPPSLQSPRPQDPRSRGKDRTLETKSWI
ncbi:unnamed protein product [Linum trigynum]|uniref:Uncharacterized protein n=1 Tax=Linum trigynum TaxID=586398 RepID=A0AAV2EAB5_9ROSI